MESIGGNKSWRRNGRYLDAIECGGRTDKQTAEERKVAFLNAHKKREYERINSDGERESSSRREEDERKRAQMCTTETQRRTHTRTYTQSRTIESERETHKNSVGAGCTVSKVGGGGERVAEMHTRWQ